MNVEQALQQGWQHHQAGRAAQAETLYRQVIQAVPDDPRAYNVLGLLEQERGQLPSAADLFRHAIALRGDIADFHFNLAFVLEDRHQTREAAAEYEAGLRINPNVAEP